MRTEVVNITLNRDRGGVVISEQGRPEVLGRVRRSASGGFTLMIFPGRLGDSQCPEGWKVFEDLVSGTHYTRHVATSKPEAVEECLFQILVALRGCGCVMHILGFPDIKGERPAFWAQHSLLPFIAHRAAKGVYHHA